MIALQEGLRRHARSLGLLIAIAAVAAAVGWSHAAPRAHGMDDDGPIAEAVSVCLAVVQLGLGTLVLVGGVRILRRWRRFETAGWSARSLTCSVTGVGPWPRAGPELLQVFRL